MNLHPLRPGRQSRAYPLGRDHRPGRAVEWLDAAPDDDSCGRCWPRPATVRCAWCEARLAPESEIVWLEDPGRFDYVRESSYQYFTSRTSRPSWRHHAGRLVGYSTLKPAVLQERPGGFRRRVFWLKEYDRDGGDALYARGAPCEAVDPRTVAPNVAGCLTDRAWTSPLAVSTRIRARTGTVIRGRSS